MVIRIHRTKEYASNKGSASNLINYLEKENEDLDSLNQEYFFNHNSGIISSAHAKRTLDDNHRKLGKNDTKFYMLTINPSEKELIFIENNKVKIKSYVKNVMNEYAKILDKVDKNGVKLEGKDLVYFAKVENKRTYKFDEIRFHKEMKFNKAISKKIRNIDKKLLNKEVSKRELKKYKKEKNILKNQYKINKNGVVIKEGNLKDGNNMHIHVVVSRYDKDQKFKLSPLANAKKTKNQEVGKTGERKKCGAGFDRDLFVENCEKIFDKQFSYDRPKFDSYNYYKTAKTIKNTISAFDNPEFFAKTMAKKVILDSIKDKTLQKAIGMATTDPSKIPKLQLQKIEQKIVKSIVKSLATNVANINPAIAVYNVAKKIISTAGKSMGI